MVDGTLADGVADELAAVLAGAFDPIPSASMNGVAWVGAEMLRLARMLLGEALVPYALRFASSSGRSTPPERLIPANSPFAREYARISAVSDTSVLTCPCRPTGPAATDASAPRLTLFFSSFCTPLSFITSITTSISSAPAWNPQLPLASWRKTGALHPSPARQLITPFPYSPPKMRAAFLRSGITATQRARSQ